MKSPIASLIAALVAGATLAACSGSSTDTAMKSDSMKADAMKSADAMKPADTMSTPAPAPADAMKSDAMKSDAMKTDTMKTDSMATAPAKPDTMKSSGN